jgi:two-component system sensor histidine kinase AtoS
MLTVTDYETLLHEIQNAVATVSCSLQLIEKQHPEVRDFDFWQDTASDLSGLRLLLVDVVNTRLRDCPLKTRVNIEQFLQDVKESCSKACDPAHTLILNVEPGLPEGYFDAFRIQHALLRILDNAFDSLCDNGIVTLSAFSKDGGIVFEVKDNGKGISEDALPQIFQPFFGFGNGKNGLGLPISKGIVDGHGGTLNVSSAIGKGTTITIYLPFEEPSIPSETTDPKSAKS